MRDEFEEKLAEKLGEEYEQTVEGKISEFGGLLSRNAAIRLLCKQHGIQTEKRLALSVAAKSLLPFSFQAKVDRIFPLQEYKNGAEKSVRLHLSDNGGEATLVLWNEQTALVEGSVSIGDEIECTGAHVRGGEMHLGRGGTIKKLGGPSFVQVSKLAQGICNVEGRARGIEPDYDYAEKKSGEKKTLSSFMLCENGDCKRVVIWSSPAGTPNPEEGDLLLLENVTFKNGEIHFNSYSRMVKKESRSILSGKLEKLEAYGEQVVFTIGGEKFELPIHQALEFLNIRHVPEGVEASTLLLIKAESIVGKDVKYKIEGKTLAWLGV